LKKCPSSPELCTRIEQMQPPCFHPLPQTQQFDDYTVTICMIRVSTSSLPETADIADKGLPGEDERTGSSNGVRSMA
jgi:hypothetical protein